VDRIIACFVSEKLVLIFHTLQTLLSCFNIIGEVMQSVSWFSLTHTSNWSDSVKSIRVCVRTVTSGRGVAVVYCRTSWICNMQHSCQSSKCLQCRWSRRVHRREVIIYFAYFISAFFFETDCNELEPW